MAVVILTLKIYLILVILTVLLYLFRHFIFTFNRMLGEQRLYYQDLVDSDLPLVSVLIPMHNEEKVASTILNSLISSDYPKEKLEIIPINDHSDDRTPEILDIYARDYQYIKPLHRTSGKRGKPSALNEAMVKAQGEIIAVFDADYLPPKGALRDMAVCFKDPEIGVVMGRVIPINSRQNLLTRFLDMERSAGYQVDQQARHNLRLIPQYGGTVGGFRKKVFLSLGSFDSSILAEDTELTFRLFMQGWKVTYANRLECYEESPENWLVRGKQIRRWARGHTQVMFKYLIPLLRSPVLNWCEKIDGSLLLCIYAFNFLLFLGMIDSVALFFMGEVQIIPSLYALLMIASFNTFGNFAPFYQVGCATFLDGSTLRVTLLPFLFFNFLFNLWYINLGSLDAIIDKTTGRLPVWVKTERFRVQQI